MFQRSKAKAIYVKVYENRFVIKVLGNGKSPVTVFADEPFTTRRLLVGQFTEAERALIKGFAVIGMGKWFSRLPDVVIHPVEKIDDGLSEVEERVLKELAASAGAGKVTIWVGKELSDAEVQQLATHS